MAKIKFAVSKEDFEKAGKDEGDFVVPKPGYYVASLKECNSGYSKDSDGNEDKKRPRLECIYTITGVGREAKAVTENYGNLWDYVSFSESSAWKRAEFLLAFGLADGSGDTELNIDTDDVVGKSVLIRVKTEAGRNKGDAPRAKIAKLLPYEDADTADAFGGGDDEPEEDTESDEEDAVLTLEELLEMDLKELGELAKEYDIDPQEFVVRNKKKVDVDATKDAVAQAILEAQGDPEEDDQDDDGDDDSPF